MYSLQKSKSDAIMQVIKIFCTIKPKRCNKTR